MLGQSLQRTRFGSLRLLLVLGDLSASEDEEVQEGKQNADGHERQSGGELRPTSNSDRADDAKHEQDRDHDEHADEAAVAAMTKEAEKK